MNNKYIFIFFIFIIFSAISNAQLRIYPNTLVLRSQYDVDTFQNNYNAIDGGLIIGSVDSFNKTNIINISKLLGIKYISKDIRIRNNKRLKNLHGLDSVVYAGVVGVLFENNDSLLNVRGLDNWANWYDTSNASITFENNPQLVDVGLKSLTKLGFLSLYNNASLRVINGYNSISYIAGYIGVYRSEIDSINGFDNCKYIAKAILSNSKIKNISGLDNIESLNLEITDCEIDSIQGAYNTGIKQLSVINCRNLKKIDFGKGLLTSNFEFFPSSRVIIEKCQNLTTVNNPINIAKSILCYLDRTNIKTLNFDKATLLSLNMKNNPSFQDLNIPNADTLSLGISKCPSFTNIFAPKATILTDYTNSNEYSPHNPPQRNHYRDFSSCYNNKINTTNFPKVKRIIGSFGVYDSLLKFVNLPELEDAIFDPYLDHNQVTGLLSLVSYDTTKVSNPNISKFNIPKFKWGSFSSACSNTIIDLSKLEEFNFLSLWGFNNGNDVFLNPYLHFNNYRLYAPINQSFTVPNYYIPSNLESFKRIDIYNCSPKGLPKMDNVSGLVGYLSLGKLKSNFDTDYFKNISRIVDLNIGFSSPAFTNLKFLNQKLLIYPDSLYNGGMDIYNNLGLDMCNTLCHTINNWNFFSFNNININNNLTGCNTRSEILQSCAVSTKNPQNNNIYYIDVYPNPTNSGNTINIPLEADSENTLYELINLTGVSVFKYTGNNNRITLPKLSSGIYILSSKKGSKVYMSKVVIQ